MDFHRSLTAGNPALPAGHMLWQSEDVTCTLTVQPGLTKRSQFTRAIPSFPPRSTSFQLSHVFQVT